MTMSSDRWDATNRYIDDLFGQEDSILEELRVEARAAGLPAIEVSSGQGRFLQLLASMADARDILEIGTLGGYSTIWLARGMAPDGRLITVEYEDRHADFAEAQFEKAGLADRIEVRRGDGHDIVAALQGELGDDSLDLVFVDADKDGYPAYWRALRSMVRVGGLILIDNALGTGSTWIDDLSSPGVRAIDEANRMAAEDPDYETALLSIREGLLVGRRVR